MAVTLETIGRNGACDGVVDQLDSGFIVFQTAAHAEVATCTFAATAFGAAAVGVATAAAIGDDTTAIAGTVSHAHVQTSGPADVLTATCTASGGGGDFIFTSLVIGTNDTVSVTSLTITMPAS